jgi:hypothetical protein
MQINPPFGYREIVPLYKNNKLKLPEPGTVSDRGGMRIPPLAQIKLTTPA